MLEITFNFSGLIEARKFVGKAIDASTGTTLAKRSSDKVKSALDLTDDTLGLDYQRNNKKRIGTRYKRHTYQRQLQLNPHKCGINLLRR